MYGGVRRGRGGHGAHLLRGEAGVVHAVEEVGVGTLRDLVRKNSFVVLYTCCGFTHASAFGRPGNDCAGTR